MAKDWARMEEEARILIVDDDESTCRSMKVIFEAKNYDADIVHSGQEAIAATKKRPYNLAIIDIRLPDVDGIALLEQLSKMNADLGIIMITGYASMETAVDALNKGAAAYITKPLNMDEVLITVNKSLEKQRLTRAKLQTEAAIQAERDRAQKYLDIAGVMIVALDSDGRVTLVNRRGCEILGYDSKEIIGKDWFKTFLPKRLRKETYDLFRSITKGKIEPGEHSENLVLTKDGEERIIAWFYTVLTDESGMATGTLSSGADITERKEAEEQIRVSEEKYKRLFETSKDGIVYTTLDGSYIDINQGFLNIVGYDREDLLSMTYLDITPEKWARAEAEILKTQVGIRGYSDEYEKEYICKDGTVVPVSIKVWQVKNDEDRPLHAIAVIRDITERKRAEEALKTSQQLVKRTFDSLSEAVLVLEAGTAEIMDCNPAAETVFDYSRHEMLGQKINMLHVNEAMYEELVKNLYLAIEEKGFLNRFEHRMKRRDGTAFPTEHSVTPLKNEQGTRVGWVSVIHDITERKRAEEALRESEEWFRTIFEESPIAINVFNLDGNLIHANPALLNLVGVSSVEDLKDFNIFRDPNMPEGGIQRIRNNESARYQSVIDFAKVKEAGLYDTSKSGVSHVDVRMSPLKYGEDESLHGYMIQMVDVTEQRKAEEEIKYLASLTDKVSDAIISTDSDFMIRSWNSGAEWIYGWTAEEAIGKHLKDFLQTETIGVSTGSSMKQLLEIGRWSGEALQTRKDGSTVHIYISASLLVDKKGTPTGAVIVNADITERKLAEDAIKQSEERYRKLYDEVRAGLLTTRVADGKFVQCNAYFVEMFGFESREQAIAEGISPERYVNPDKRQQIISELKSSGVFNGEMAVTKPDGTPVWVEVRSRIDLEEGTIQSAFLDITERKRAEEALRESEEWFRTIFEESPIAINVFDLDGNLIQANPALLNLVGVSSVQDFKNFNIFKDPNMPEGGIQRIRNNERARYQSVIDFAKVKEAGLYDTSKSGVSHVDVRMSPLKYGEDESKHGYMIQMVDITNRVLAEKAVEKRVKELTCLFVISQLASQSELAIDEFLKSVVELLPPAWFHAEITCARILLDGLVFTTSNFKETKWKGVADITVGTERRGAIEVYYLEQKPDLDEGPFLKEERALIDSIAELVGNAVRRWQAEEELRELAEELEQRVKKRTQDLAASNQELEAFAYSISHDLRSPLRGIAGFSKAVIEDYSNVLDETGRDYLQRMHDATVRMSELIDDILSLSRVSREKMHSEEIDMTALARTIAGNLRSQEPKRKAKLVISKNLEAYGDKRLLRLVLENLLGNAWKFSSKEQSARIDFGATEQENETVFFVRDNGAGFDMKYVDKLFNVFQRLHHADEFEGTGIGLAIVKRIVRRHGGRTWAEGDVGTGATFYFALPSKGSEVLT